MLSHYVQGGNFAHNNSAHNNHTADPWQHEHKECNAHAGPPLLCGCARRTCLIVTAAIVGVVLLIGITLGVGLGVGLNQKVSEALDVADSCSNRSPTIFERHSLAAS